MGEHETLSSRNSNVVVMCRHCTHIYYKIDIGPHFTCEHCGETVDPNDPNGRSRVPPRGSSFNIALGVIVNGKPLYKIGP